jgi:hypothetical protein
LDGQRFDDIARALARTTSRRGLARALAGGVAALGAVFLHSRAGDAAEPERGESNPRRDGRCRSAARHCRAGEICQNKRCVSCWPEKIPCGNVCVDPLKDPRNCGDCGIVCGDGEVCGEGFCGQPCVDNFDCPDNLDFHCELGACFGGACSIIALDCNPDGPGLDCCKTADDFFCVDFATDPRHCGRCYNDCGDAGCC